MMKLCHVLTAIHNNSVKIVLVMFQTGLIMPIDCISSKII